MPPALLPDHGYALAGGQRGMEITVQITIKSPAGEPERIQQVAHLQRETLQSDNLGLSLAQGALDLGGAGTNNRPTASGRVCRASLPLPSMRPGACLQGPPYDRVPHPLW